MSGIYIGVDGVARKVKKLYVGVDGVAKEVHKVYVGVGGVARRRQITGKKLSEYAVGDSVYLNENGSPAEYIIVQKGLPSTQYSASCAGVWLMRKDIYATSAWNSTNRNNYGASTIHSYLNNDFIAVLDSSVRNIIMQAKIPYVNGSGGSSVAASESGLTAKAFLLSGYEIGFTQSVNENFPIDGACLAYFNGANNAKRICYQNGAANNWWTRSPYNKNAVSPWAVNTNGNAMYYNATSVFGVRPTLILPHDAVFDPDTNICKGG